VSRALPDHAGDKPLEIWFQDEARIGQKGTLTRLWARTGSRPRAPRDTRYEWAYLFGAVCPQRAVGAALVLPYADSQAMNLHLREIGRTVAPGAHAVLVLDAETPPANNGFDPYRSKHGVELFVLVGCGHVSFLSSFSRSTF
jgi:hypothetical protein